MNNFVIGDRVIITDFTTIFPPYATVPRHINHYKFEKGIVIKVYTDTIAVKFSYERIETLHYKRFKKITNDAGKVCKLK